MFILHSKFIVINACLAKDVKHESRHICEVHTYFASSNQTFFCTICKKRPSFIFLDKRKIIQRLHSSMNVCPRGHLLLVWLSVLASWNIYMFMMIPNFYISKLTFFVQLLLKRIYGLLEVLMKSISKHLMLCLVTSLVWGSLNLPHCAFLIL
jgi:hypothetical protein